MSPMVGKGTVEDPRRPAILEARAEKLVEAGVDYTLILSDDGKFAIVELSLGRVSGAAVKKLREATASKESAPVAFESGVASRETVEKEIKKYKKDFSLDELGGFRAAGGVK